MAAFTHKLCCALLRCASKTQEAQQRIEQLRTAPRNAAPQRAAYVWTALYCDSKTRSNWTHDQQHDVCVCIKLVSVLEASVYPTACCKQIYVSTKIGIHPQFIIVIVRLWLQHASVARVHLRQLILVWLVQRWRCEHWWETDEFFLHRLVKMNDERHDKNEGTSIVARAFQFGQKSFDSILATESIFSIRFDSTIW